MLKAAAVILPWEAGLGIPVGYLSLEMERFNEFAEVSLMVLT